MDLKQAILEEHSKAQAEKIKAYVGPDQEKFALLMNLFLNETYRVTQRAAMAVGLCAQKYPFLIKPYLELMIKNLQKPVHDAVRRNTLRILQNQEIPPDLQGETMDICFSILNTNSEPIAIKVFAMTVLTNLAEIYPELSHELILIIEDQMPYGSAGFKSRGNKILKKLRQLNPKV
ncbi:MAG: hypothetical protein ACNS62_15070 [Candidatus Cyclobacteriaceae bacterium M3_2C_046]